MVHEIFHAMFESNESMLCWVIHIATETRGKILNIKTSLNSDVHDATNPLIEGSSIWFIKNISPSPMIVVAMNSVFSNHASTGKVDCWNFTSYFFFFPQYSWIMFFMMRSVWSLLIPYLPWIILMLGSFSFGTYWKVNSKRVSNSWIKISKKI